MNDFDKCYAWYVAATEKALTQYVPIPQEEWNDSSMPARLVEAMRYSLLAGGKRLRPVMLLAACHMLSESLEEALPFAAAIEMIHTYSLVHDDLPAMDNDDMRRGNPTNHRMFGEGMAILAGDGLLTQAFEVMAASGHPHALKGIAVIARCAGTSGMIAGQVADLAMEGKAPELSMVSYIQRHKTADLFAAAIKTGLILADAPLDWLKAAEVFALHYGLAFQITDDLLDIKGQEDILGKTIGKDAAAGKMTWPATVGLEQAEADAKRHAMLALEAAQVFGDIGDFFTTLAQQVLVRVK